VVKIQGILGYDDM